MNMNPTLRAILLAASLCVVAGLAAARSADLIEPARTQIVLNDATKPMTPTTVRRAIIAGGSTHSWKPVADKPGVLTLEADSGQHQVIADVLYDAQGFQVKYKRSANMNHAQSGDKVTVHPKVNKWLADLNESIRSAAAAAQGQSN